jgi:hypothetical protein
MGVVSVLKVLMTPFPTLGSFIDNRIVIHTQLESRTSGRAESNRKSHRTVIVSLPC